MLPNSRPRNRCKIAGGGGLTAWFRACYLYSVFPLTAGNSSQSSLSSRCIFLYLDRQYPALQNGPNRLPNPCTRMCPRRTARPPVVKAAKKAVREEAKKAAFERGQGPDQGREGPRAERTLL